MQCLPQSETLDSAESLQQTPENSQFNKTTSVPSTSTSDPNLLVPQAINIDTNDPGTWPDQISDNVRTLLVQAGPNLVLDYDSEFPVNDKGRRFTTSHYKTKLPNGEITMRRWLIYSKEQNCVYCFACKINLSQLSKLGREGYNDWKHISKDLKMHESSMAHIESMRAWIDLENRLKTNTTIDEMNQRVIRLEIERWKCIFRRLFAVTHFLAAKNMAFRGTNEQLYQPQNGNFLSLVELIAKFDNVMQEHVTKALRKEIPDHYLGKRIQNELILLLADATKSEILKKREKAKYYTVMLDCTPDISKTEQISLCLRFVHIADENVNICEHFLEFFEAEGSTGEKLTEVLLNKLEDLKIPIQDCRGQAYDNGANMKGKNVGVQRRILDINSRAFYLPCAAHTLNLVVGDAARRSVKGVNFFGFLSKIYTFFAGSTKRWAVLKKHATSLTLKPLSETRWESRIDSVQVLRFQLFEVYSALIELADTLEDSEFRYEAQTLSNCMCDFAFVVSIVVWHEILSHIAIASKKLQTISYDIQTALSEIQKVKSFLEDYRDTGFEKVLETAKELADELGIQAEFSKIADKRISRKKRQFNYEVADEPIVCPKGKYKIEFFNVVVDVAKERLTERFSQLNEHAKLFGILYDMHDLREKEDKEILQHCNDLQLALDVNGSSDINGVALFEELKNLRHYFDSSSSALQTLAYLVKNGYQELFPNTVIALRILLTSPVTVASNERSFLN